MRLFLLILMLLPIIGKTQQQIKMHGELKEFEITAKIHPDTIASSPVWMIKDFAFMNDDIYILTWEKRPEKCVLRRINQNGRELYNKEIDGEVYGFYTDVFNQLFVELKDETLLIQSSTYGFKTFQVDEQVYYKTIRPTVAKNDSFYVGSTWHPEKPDFAYIFGNKIFLDTLQEIRDPHLYELYYSEYRFLPFQMQCAIKRQCRETGQDKYELAAQASGFTHSLWWRKLYSPLIKMQDSLYITDHYSDSLFVFDADGKKARSHSISFHKEKGYGKEVMFDEFTNTWYARFFRNGKTKLCQLDINGVQVAEPFELSYRYVEKVKLHNGRAYYLYRPFESSQNTFLYSEVLPARMQLANSMN
jgi:hypothetical protein